MGNEPREAKHTASCLGELMRHCGETSFNCDCDHKHNAAEASSGQADVATQFTALAFFAHTQGVKQSSEVVAVVVDHHSLTAS